MTYYYQNLIPKEKFAKTSLCIALALISFEATAQTVADAGKEVKPIILESSSVTAEYLGESSDKEVKRFAGNRTVISSQTIQENASSSIDQALQQVPGVKIMDETGTGVLPNLSVRGLNASRSGHAQFLLDGVPLTLAPYAHTGQSVFPATLKNLDRIDVVRGGAATQYGPNNVGGVINLVSNPIPSKTESELSTKVTVFEENGKALTNLYGRHSQWLGDDFALQVEANQLAGDSFRDHSDTKVTNVQAKALWYIADAQELEGMLQVYDADTQMPGALSPKAYKEDVQQSQRPLEAYQGKSTRWHAKYKNYMDIADGAVLDVMTFGHRSKRNFEWGFNSDFKNQGVHWADPAVESDTLRTSPRDFKVYGVEPKFSVKLNDVAGTNHNILTGVRVVSEDINYKLTQRKLSDTQTVTPRDWALSTDAVAFFVSDEIKSSNDKLTITPGVRFERADMTFKDLGKNSLDDNTITEWLPGLSMSYVLNEAQDTPWIIYGNAQKSLRTPQIAYIRGKGEEGSELAWNYEVGTRYSGENVQANLGFYRIDFEDQLQWNSAQQTFDNVGHTLHDGFESSITYSPEALKGAEFGLTYNFLNATLEEGSYKGNQLPYASKHQLGWRTSYGKQGWLGTLSGVYFSKAFADNANTEKESSDGAVGETPAYTLWNASLQKTLMEDDNQSLKLNLAVNNLFDEQYYFRGIDTSPVGRYPAPGRSYQAELNYQF